MSVHAEVQYSLWMQPTGAYTAERAAALSGVPKSTLHYWARTRLIVPSVSHERVKLWSYTDLMVVRTVYWLRATKTSTLGAEIPRTGMPLVRRAIAQLRAIGEPLWHPERNVFFVDQKGELHVRQSDGIRSVRRQHVLPGALDLIAPFASSEGLRGPDLARPRASLRIAPGRLSGSPHVVSTRLETRAVAALERDGLSPARILQLYPYVTAEQIAEAIDLERQLEANIRAAA